MYNLYFLYYIGGFIDNVVRQKPQVVKRNRDVIVALSKDTLKDASDGLR